MRPCYKFSNLAAADNSPAVLTVFEDIGFWGVQAKEFMASIAAVASDKISVEINSPGGDVQAAIAMYNALRASGKEITTKVMGVAASAASFLFLAGDKREMPENTFLMVHSASSYPDNFTAAGMKETVEILEKVDGVMNNMYASRTGMTPEAVTALMSKDSWITAAEAKDMGFATEITTGVKATASFDMDRADLPNHVRAVYMTAAKLPVALEPTPADPLPVDPAPEILDAPVAKQIDDKVTAAGLTEFAADIVLAASSLADGEARIAHAREVVALCAIAKAPTSAVAAIKAFTPVADVRKALLTAKAEADEHTSTVIKADQHQQKSGGISSESIWASHNKQSAANSGKK